jgi:hypothetical protein
MERSERLKLVNRANVIPIAAGCLVFLSPMLMFWGAAFGPLKPFSYPHPLGFLFWFGVSFLPFLLPRSYYRPGNFDRARRLYGPLGVPSFRRFVSNGDLVNWWVRRRDPGYRVLTGRTALRGFLEETRLAERSHLMWLLMGLFTAVYAVRIGWYRWAILLTIGNIVFNLYPVLLLRYTRARIGIVS